MLVICYSAESLKDIRSLGVTGEIVEGLPIPEDVRDQANELGCFGNLASLRNQRNGRVTFVGILSSGILEGDENGSSEDEGQGGEQN